MSGTSARFSSVHDGDTPKILKNVRMLAIDTPEKEYRFRKAAEYDNVLSLHAEVSDLGDSFLGIIDDSSLV